MSIKKIIFPLVIGLGIGMLITTQFKSPRQRILNPVEPFASLLETRDELRQKASRLKDDLRSERQEISRLQEQSQVSKRANKELVDEFNRLRERVGLTEQKDRGVVVTLADAQKGELTIDSIIHAADLRDVVNVLNGAGAKAVSINDERVVATTSIDSIINTVLINNTRITSPFVIKAIGDQRDLNDAVASQNNLGDLHGRKQSAGILFNIERAKEVTVPAFSGSFPIRFARIVE